MAECRVGFPPSMITHQLWNDQLAFRGLHTILEQQFIMKCSRQNSKYDRGCQIHWRTHAHTHTPSVFCTLKMWHGTCASCSMVLLVMPEQRLRLHFTPSFATLFRLCKHVSAPKKWGQIVHAETEWGSFTIRQSITQGHQQRDKDCFQIPSYLNCKGFKELLF